MKLFNFMKLIQAKPNSIWDWQQLSPSLFYFHQMFMSELTWSLILKTQSCWNFFIYPKYDVPLGDSICLVLTHFFTWNAKQLNLSELEVKEVRNYSRFSRKLYILYRSSRWDRHVGNYQIYRNIRWTGPSGKMWRACMLECWQGEMVCLRLEQSHLHQNQASFFSQLWDIKYQIPPPPRY